MDSIRLTGIRAAAGQGGSPSACSGHGQAPYWRDLCADIAVELDLREAIADDDITETVDYAQLIDRVRQVMVTGAHDCTLLEAIAGRIAQAVLLSHRARGVDVMLHAGHPRGADIDDITVHIHRLADDGDHADTTPAAQASGSMPRHKSCGQCDGGRHGGDGEHADTAAQAQQPSHAVIAMRGGDSDGEQLMRAAVVALDSVPGNQVTGISPLYHVSAIDGPESMSAVVLVNTRLDLPALSHMLGSISARHQDSLALHAVMMRSETGDSPREEVGWRDAKTSAAVLAPWMDIEPDASFDGDPLSYLLALAPDATQVGLLSDRWILGGMQ